MVDERRDRLVEAYASAFGAWRELIGRLDDADWSTPTGCPGWDARDQLAHVVALERVLLGEAPDDVTVPDDLPYIRNAAGRAVEAGVQARRPVPVDALVAEAHETFDRRLAQLRELDPAWLDQEISTPLPGLTMRGSRLLRTRVFDLTSHEYDVRRAVGRVDAPGGSHVAISTELVVRGWSRVLPAVVDGDAVLGVELDGVELARIHLGTGELFRGDDGGAADAVLGVSLPQLLAIAGGRDDAPALTDMVARGDVEVVRRVLAAGSITP